MSFFDKLTAAIASNDSLLCVGLDPVIEQTPARYRSGDNKWMTDILRWNLNVVSETYRYACCYKPNIAFYEALGPAGMELLRQTLVSIPDDIPVILDAKRGDIGSTAQAYAKACFDLPAVDAVTLSPYLGRDSVDAFTAYEGKAAFVLCHTSNPSAGDLQTLLVDGRPLYLHVAEKAVQWSPNVGLVVGATYPSAVREVRAVAPNAWFLVPGIGAQGGDVERVVTAGLCADGHGLIISASRGISQADDHKAAARQYRDMINQARKQVASA
ncbi:MAG: orotidine-5'-phosphate decarboxylase [Caldilineaceae bacterium]|nr:orotidine-5'-phosphate decarboxylase [Caldilineaceae bacterium]